MVSLGEEPSGCDRSPEQHGPRGAEVQQDVVTSRGAARERPKRRVPSHGTTSLPLRGFRH